VPEEPEAEAVQTVSIAPPAKYDMDEVEFMSNDGRE